MGVGKLTLSGLVEGNAERVGGSSKLPGGAGDPWELGCVGQVARPEWGIVMAEGSRRGLVEYLEQESEHRRTAHASDTFEDAGEEIGSGDEGQVMEGAVATFGGFGAGGVLASARVLHMTDIGHRKTS